MKAPRLLMLRFALTRIGMAIPTFIGITLLTFFLIRLVPGDPIETMAGERGIDPARHEQLRREFGLDEPLLVQYPPPATGTAQCFAFC